MAPGVLHRVCHGSMAPENPIYASHNLKIVTAVLSNHRRHRVKHADYPAIIPAPGATVRGTYVTGLTDADVWRLDIFEGSEYKRVKVKARVGEQGEGIEVEAETYVWIAGEDALEDYEWDFEEFKREKMKFWVGSECSEEGIQGRESIMGIIVTGG